MLLSTCTPVLYQYTMVPHSWNVRGMCMTPQKIIWHIIAWFILLIKCFHFTWLYIDKIHARIGVLWEAAGQAQHLYRNLISSYEHDYVMGWGRQKYYLFTPTCHTKEPITIATSCIGLPMHHLLTILINSFNLFHIVQWVELITTFATNGQGTANQIIWSLLSAQSNITSRSS